MKVFYFTGTGNSLVAARAVAGAGQLISMPRFLRELPAADTEGGCDAGPSAIIQDDCIGLVFPTYWLAVPLLVERFLARVRLQSPFIFAVVTRGNASLTVKAHLLQLARANGFALSAFHTVSMPDNYLPLCDMDREARRFAAGSIEQRLARIQQAVGRRQRNIGGLAALAPLRAALVAHAKAQVPGFAQRFTVAPACNGCATCASVCPAANIRIANDRPAYADNCLTCLACVHNCPQQAIQMARQKSAARYRHPQASLQDIIAANGRA